MPPGWLVSQGCDKGDYIWLTLSKRLTKNIPPSPQNHLYFFKDKRTNQRATGQSIVLDIVNLPVNKRNSPVSLIVLCVEFTTGVMKQTTRGKFCRVNTPLA